ncbi:MAG: hypothetical protein VX755_01660 [Pseudomonadota bacterium]|nr:hypothetical protein [Pseudomonadota bacterium]MED5538669.1 hypothetical protein [Pseudomonadota bacterium]
MSIHPVTIYLVSPDRSHVVSGLKTEAVDIASYGKLMVLNVSALRIFGFDPAEAEQLSEADLLDFIAFHVIDRAGVSTRHRYEAGAARWAARASSINDNITNKEAA